MRTNGSAVVEFCRGGEFRETMRLAGLEPPTPIKPGNFYRFPGIGKKHGNVDGWCLLFDDEHGGAFGDWSTGLSETWQAKKNRSPAEEEAFKRQIAESRKRAKAEQEASQAQAAVRAAEILEASSPAPADHPHLLKKKMAPYDLRVDDGRLVVALRDTGGNLRTIQYIAADGTKRLLKGGALKAHFWTLGNITSETPYLYVCEGISTAAAIHAALSECVVAAMSAQNLKPVAEALHARYPGARIVFCADDDFATDGNPGMEAATEAAHAVGGIIAVPQFPEPRDPASTDWCDLALLSGLKAVKTQMDELLAAVDLFETPPPQATPSTSAEDGRIVAELAMLSLLDYDRRRKDVADQLGVRAPTLDKLVSEKREKMQAEAEEFATVVEELTPWQNAVDGRELLNEISETISAHVVLPPGACTVVTLWAIGTYCMAAWQLWAKLLISSPEKRCGKSTLLEALEGVCYRPLLTSSITASSLFRCIQEWQPTLLIDEADCFAKDDDALNGIVNAGHRKRTAVVIRSEKEGDTFKPKKFSVWSPQVIAGIRDQRDTLRDRSIQIEMRRKLPGETVRKMPVDFFEQQQPIRRQCLRWAEDNLRTLKSTHPTAPPCGNDRAENNWEPLFAIADLVGGQWPERVLGAYQIAVTRSDEDDTVALKLLADIRDIFTDQLVEVMHSYKLVKILINLESRPWCEWRRGKPLTQNSLAKLLTPFNIKSSQLKIGGVNRHGYRKTDFQDTWRRYLSLETPAQNATSLQASDTKGFSSFQGATPKNEVADEKPLKPSDTKGCSAVAFEKRCTEGTRMYPPELLEAATRACSGLRLSAGAFISQLDTDDYAEIIANSALARATAQSMDLSK